MAFLRLAMWAAAAALCMSMARGATVAPASSQHFTVLRGHDLHGHDLARPRARNVDELKIACLYTPGCTGFNTLGYLKNNTAGAAPNPDEATDLYTLAPGPPSAYHYLQMPRSDADHEDLRRAPRHSTVAELEALCSNDTACAGFNSDGWLKGTVQTIQKATCDLYAKLGGEPHPLPPAPPPPPSPPRPPPPPPPPGPWLPQIWPLPMSVRNGSTVLALAVPQGGAGGGLFRLAQPTHDCATLTAAFERYACSRCHVNWCGGPVCVRACRGARASREGGGESPLRAHRIVLPVRTMREQALDSRAPATCARVCAPVCAPVCPWKGTRGSQHRTRWTRHRKGV